VSTTVIVVIGIWNGLLLGGLVAVIVWRKQVLEWITGIDHWNRNERDSADGNRDDSAWVAFLEEHPELFELEVRAGKARDS
jgi:hypothetical protein